MSEWQPIETAPKDERVEVLLFRPEHPAGIGYWNPEKHARKPRPFWDGVGHRGVLWARDNPPTHWMPLPAPPVTP